MARYFLRYRHSDTGLTPTFTFFKKASDLTTQTSPVIGEVGGGTYFFDASPTFDIVFEVDGGASIPTEEVRYIADTISPKDIYIDEPTSQVKDDVWNDATNRGVGTKGDFVEHIGINSDAVNAATVFGQMYKARDVVMGGTGFGGTGVDIKTVNDTVNIIDGNTTPTAVEAAVWDAQLSAHAVPGSFGLTKQVLDLGVSGGALASNTIALDGGASVENEFYTNAVIFITTGVAINQVRNIIAYDGVTQTATVERDWTGAYVPANGDTYMIFATAQLSAGKVWDESINGHISDPQSTGTALNAAHTYTSPANIADSVWDAGTVGHIDPGSMGELVNDAAANTGGLSGIANAVWDAATSAHTVAGSFGQTLQLEDSGLATGGALATVTLKAGASAITDFYKNGLIAITSGTGVGQSRSITAYDGATKIATVDRTWGTTPIAGDGYIVLPAAPSSSLTNAGIAGAVWDEAIAGHVGVGSTGEKLNSGGVSAATLAAAVWDEAITTHTINGTFGQTLQLLHYGQATGGAASTITLAAGASAITNFYNNALLAITAGTGMGQARTIISYSGGTKQATVDRAWLTNPDPTSRYMIIPAAQAPLDTASIADAVWDEALSGHLIAGSTGAKLEVSGSVVKFFSNGDTDNPIIVQVTSPKHTQVKVTYSEPVVMTTATNGALNILNYSIPGLTILAVAALTSQQVMITTSTQIAGNLYTLTITNVEDLVGNPIL